MELGLGLRLERGPERPGRRRRRTRLASTSAALWCSSASLSVIALSALEICVLSRLSRSSAAASRAGSMPVREAASARADCAWAERGSHSYT